MLNMNNWKQIGFMSILFFFTVGCSMLPSPVETIKAPVSIQEEETVNDLRIKIQAVLPQGAKLLTPAHPQKAEEIQLGDIDGDGSNEALVIYEENVNSQRRLWAALLKAEEQEWKIIWQTQGVGHDIDYVNLADITGDGQLEVLLGWTLGASVGNGLDIYRWTTDSLELMTQTGYHLTLDVENMPSLTGENAQSAIAIWTKDTGSAYQVDVYRWSEAERELIPAEDVYPYYFKKVVQYYRDQTSQQPDWALLWYYLADAQLKTNMIDEALQSIEKGLVLEETYPSKEQFEKLKERTQSTVEYISQQMTIGRSQEEIKLLLGSQYAEVENALNGGIMWRYDYVSKEGYTFNSEGMDSVDIEGLVNGSLKIQLFISWTKEGTAESYAIYYTEDGKVQEQRLFSDGGVRQTTIFP